MIPVIYDTAERTLTRLSLFGDGDLVLEGNHLTRFHGRRPLVVHDSMFRKFTCVEGCHVCCTMSHTLDWLPSEFSRSSMKYGDIPAHTRLLQVNNGLYPIWTQSKTGACPHLVPNRLNGGLGCAFWPDSPIECWAALNMRVMEKNDEVSITKQPMARAWRYHPSPECQFTNVPLEEMDLETNISIFERYLEWAEYFDVSSAIDRIERILIQFHLIVKGQRRPVSFVVS